MVPEDMLAEGWKRLLCSKSTLDISIVLCSGQSFRWRELDGVWTGVHKRKVWQLKQDENQIWYKVLNRPSHENTDQKVGMKRKVTESLKIEQKHIKLDCNENHVMLQNDGLVQSEREILEDYFQFNVDLDKLCNAWCESDKHFASVKKLFPGVRMLRQDPVENLFSFICSSNNNIQRISSMVEKLCSKFGEKIYECDETVYHAFPTVETLAKPSVESILRKLSFGYRAKYIHDSAVQIEAKGGGSWLHNLRTLPYEEAHSDLTKLSGIGSKVADCICMMSLDKPQAIPVDTHVWQIATRDYKISSLKNTKTLTAASYKAIGDFFRTMWGDHASWAMNFLFVADLKQFQHVSKKENPSHRPLNAKRKAKTKNS